MKSIKEFYLGLVEGVGDAPSWKKDWRWVVLYSLIVYAIVLAFRMSFAGRWDHPELWVNGERIMATHDAYLWLAQAKGVGVLVNPLGQLARMLHGFFGFSLGDIGFWTPAILSALIGVACCLWGCFLGGVHAGIFAGLVGSLTPGFFFRSRLGYFDTDMFTLLGPVIIALLLAIYVSFWTKKTWFFSSMKKPGGAEISSVAAYCTALLFGLVTRFLCTWHFDILNIAVLYFFLSAIVLLVNARPGMRPHGLYGLIVFLFAAFPGASFSKLGAGVLLLPIPFGFELTYILLAIFVCVALVIAEKRDLVCVHNIWVCIAMFLFAIWLTDIAVSPVTEAIEKLAGYFQGSVGGIHMAAGGSPAGKAPLFPSIVQSIIEAKLVPVGEILQRGAFFGWLGWVALMLSIAVTVLRPMAVFLLPLVALQLLSITFGIRFAMFGGASLMICLGVGIALLVEVFVKRLRFGVGIILGVQLLLGGALLGHCYSQYSKIPLTPVVSRSYAEALIDLKDIASREGTVWTWWDWGYATQYFAELPTPIDGGVHSGKDVYLTALALSTDSNKQANALIRLAASHDRDPRSSNSLSSVWTKQPASDVSNDIDAMRSVEPAVKQAPPQYLVVSWKCLTVSKWITYFGNWNLETGETNEATTSTFQPGQIGFNIERGAVMNRQGAGGLVTDITVLSPEGVDMREYYLNRLSPKLFPKTKHLLINSVSKQSVLLDRIAYNSTMRRLLTDDPNDPEIRKYFKLVVDKLPFVRIYEVVQ